MSCSNLDVDLDHLAVCVGCGCNDRDGCQDGCWWLAVDRGRRTGVCSECSEVLEDYQADTEAFGTLTSADVNLLSAWAEDCRLAAAMAARNAPTDHMLDESLSSALDLKLARLPQALKEVGLRIAMTMGYSTLEEREESRQWNADNGYCNHGIALGYCPAGCGLGPDD